MVRLQETSKQEREEQTEGTEAGQDVKRVIAEIALVILLGFLVIISFRRKEPTPVPTPTPTMTVTPTYTPTPTMTNTPTPTSTPTPTPTPVHEVKEVETGHTFKPYTGFWAYNLKGSAQWRLQQVARSDERTGIRVVTDKHGEERYIVALGTYWAGGHPEHIGRCVDMVMVNGAVLKCVLGDVKKEEDAIRSRYGRVNNDTLEFIVDEKFLSEAVKICGNVSKAGDEFEGDVEKMIVYDEWIEGFGK